MNEIADSWNGHAKLWKVFWLYNFVLGSGLIYAMDFAERFGETTEITVAVIVLVWVIWVAVSLWRCAFNASWRIWGYLTRGLLVICGSYLLFSSSGHLLG